MTQQAGVPIAAYGRDESVARGVAPLMAPEYDLVHIVVGNDPVVASKEFKAVLAGDFASLPSGGLGSNANRPDSEKRIPVVLSCGAAIQDDEFEQLKAAVGEGNFKWSRLTIADLKAAGFQGTPDPTILAKAWKEKLSNLLKV